MKRLRIPKRIIFYIAIIAFVASTVATSSILAKYIYTDKNDGINVSSKSFYFESNYLTDNNHIYKLNAGTRGVDIELYNYENELRISEVSCKYTVTVSSDDTSFTINGEVLTQKEISISADKTDTVVTLGDLKDGYDYTVTVTADGGYVKVLSATFSVAPAHDGLFMNVSENDYYVILTVWTENVVGTANISFPSGLIPDSTDAVMSGITNYENGSYVAASFSDSNSFTATFASHSYRFFKETPGDQSYSAGDFTVNIGEKSAEVKTK